MLGGVLEKCIFSLNIWQIILIPFILIHPKGQNLNMKEIISQFCDAKIQKLMHFHRKEKNNNVKLKLL